MRHDTGGKNESQMGHGDNVRDDATRTAALRENRKTRMYEERGTRHEARTHERNGLGAVKEILLEDSAKKKRRVNKE